MKIMKDLMMQVEKWSLNKFFKSNNKIDSIKKEFTNLLNNLFPVYCSKKYFIKNKLEIKKKLPFNSQIFRTKIFDKIIQSVNFDFLVETGTYLGITTSYFAKSFNKEIYTAEINTFCFNINKRNLESFKNIKIFNSDSRKMIAKLIKMKKSTDLCFFYLDAHWFNDLPLVEEIQMIFDYFSSAVIMIDDFKVVDDEGYGYDDYGKYGVLDLNLLSNIESKKNIFAYYPNCNSKNETGAKRGTVILTNSEKFKEKFDKLNVLRKINF